MKKMKLIVAISICASTIFGQVTNDNLKFEEIRNLSIEEKAQKRTDKMSQILELDENKTNQLYNINLEYAKVREQHKEKHKYLREQYKNNLSSILTNDQIQKLKEIKEKRIKQKKHKYKHSKG